jgi:mediator of RNA polymerase II transcription subunit 4
VAPTPAAQYDSHFRTISDHLSGNAAIANSHAFETKEKDKLKIHSALDRIEKEISRLVDSVRGFEPSEEHARAIIDAERDLDSAIAELIEHDAAGKRIQQLTNVSNKLDAEIKNVIMGLAECRHELQSLPSYDEESETDNGAKFKSVNADDLLAYATKITKFTHAPPGYNPQSGMEHANLPWPTEDALRKGMLAIAAMDGDDTAAVASDSAKEESSDKVEGLPESAPVESHRQRRRSSIVSYGERPIINPSSEPAAAPQAILDLDLFDPDEDD